MVVFVVQAALASNLDEQITRKCLRVFSTSVARYARCQGYGKIKSTFLFIGSDCNILLQYATTPLESSDKFIRDLPPPQIQGDKLSIFDFTPHTHARRASSHLTPSTLWV